MILPILLVVSQIVVQKTMTPPSTGNNEQAKMTQNMSMIMTVFFGYFTLQVPAGLTLYWVTSNLLQMLQQWAVTRFFQPSVPVAVSAAPAPKQVTVTAEAPAPKKNSQQPQRKAKGK
jgi:YidC/Oxa1 family membrane protein insertase